MRATCSRDVMLALSISTNVSEEPDELTLSHESTASRRASKARMAASYSVL